MNESTPLSPISNTAPSPSTSMAEQSRTHLLSNSHTKRVAYLEHIDAAIELAGNLCETVKDSEGKEEAAKSGAQQTAKFYCNEITRTIRHVDPRITTIVEKLDQIEAQVAAKRPEVQDLECKILEKANYTQQRLRAYVQQIVEHEQMKKLENDQLQPIEDSGEHDAILNLVGELQSRRLQNIQSNNRDLRRACEVAQNDLDNLKLALQDKKNALKESKSDWDRHKESEVHIALDLGTVRWARQASAEFAIKNKLFCSKYLVPTDEILEPIASRSNRSEEAKELVFTLQSMRKLVADVTAMSEGKVLPEGVSSSINATQVAAGSVDANA